MALSREIVSRFSEADIQRVLDDQAQFVDVGLGDVIATDAVGGLHQVEREVLGRPTLQHVLQPQVALPVAAVLGTIEVCLLYTSPSPRDS